MYRIGVDLGGTNIVAGVVDEYYRIVGKGKMPTACPRPSWGDNQRCCFVNKYGSRRSENFA